MTTDHSRYQSSFPPGNPTDFIPGVLVAHTTPGKMSKFYLEIENTAVIGRAEKALPLPDNGISRQHIRITRRGRICTLEDLGSSNGTFMNGKRIKGTHRIPNQAVITLGNTILVFHDDIRALRFDKRQSQWGMSGRFHTRKLIRDLTALALSPEQGILLVGPDGTGKTLAANAVASMLGRNMVIQRVSDFHSEEALASTLFGMRERVAGSEVKSAGLIAKADGGVLLLADAHRLPRRIQDRLLPLLDDGSYVAVGDTERASVDVRVILACNAPGPTFGLGLEMMARLKTVPIPPIKERVADIPSLFDSLLEAALVTVQYPPAPVFDQLEGAHYLTLMCHPFEEDNVHGLKIVAERIAADVARDVLPGAAINKAIAALSGAPSFPSRNPFDEVTRKVNSLVHDFDPDDEDA